jgi:hypothetical protein
MGRRAVVQIRFAHEDGDNRPVAASTKRRGTGARVTLEVEEEAIAAGALFVLYRRGAGVVVAGSAHRERVEAALAGLGAAYRIVRIPIEGDGVESAAG